MVPQDAHPRRQRSLAPQASAIQLFRLVPPLAQESAYRLLESFDEARRDAAFREIRRSGTPAERRGLAVVAQRRYLRPFWGGLFFDGEVDTVSLRMLRHDRDPLVRRWAERGLDIHLMRSEGALLPGLDRARNEAAAHHVEWDQLIAASDSLFQLHREEPPRLGVRGTAHLFRPQQLNRDVLRWRSTRSRVRSWERELSFGYVRSGRFSVARDDRGRLYIASGELTVALDARTGRLLWQRALGGTIAMIDGRLALAPSAVNLESTAWIDMDSGELVSR